MKVLTWKEWLWSLIVMNVKCAHVIAPFIVVESNRDLTQLRSQLESSKGDTFSGSVITDFLYGAEDGSELRSSMDDINEYATLRKWSNKQWTDLLEKYILLLKLLLKYSVTRPF